MQVRKCNIIFFNQVNIIKSVWEIDGIERALSMKVVANAHFFPKFPGSGRGTVFSGKRGTCSSDIPKSRIADFIKLPLLNEQLSLCIKQTDMHHQMIFSFRHGFSVHPLGKFSGLLAVDIINIPQFHCFFAVCPMQNSTPFHYFSQFCLLYHTFFQSACRGEKFLLECLLHQIAY